MYIENILTRKHLHLTQVKVVVRWYPHYVKPMLTGNRNQQNISTNVRAVFMIVVRSTWRHVSRILVKPLLGAIWTCVTVNKHAFQSHTFILNKHKVYKPALFPKEKLNKISYWLNSPQFLFHNRTNHIPL